VCRSGAITLAEVTRAAVPSVLVPYPFAAADHQTSNAVAMVEQGAAVLCKDEIIDREMYAIVSGLLTDAERLRQMAAAARLMARPEAARVLAAAVIHLATGRHD
jgi:UDP-N-acetylglucosamine--N-acetylmuramyl-(pentapeptide) pyrophosphoryl-undecaprenol N-acetylglucosamine transferase